MVGARKQAPASTSFHVTGGTSTDPDHVFPFRFQGEPGVKGDHSLYLTGKDIQGLCDGFNGFWRDITKCLLNLLE
jgi:hypothetical protein